MKRRANDERNDEKDVKKKDNCRSDERNDERYYVKNDK